MGSRIWAGLLASVAYAGVTGAASASYTFTFNDASQLTTQTSGFNYNPTVPNARYDFGSNTSNQATSFSSNNQLVPSPAGSGSARLSTSINSSSGVASAAFTIDLFAVSTAGTANAAPTNATQLDFDIMVESGSAQDSNAGAGYFQAVVRNDNYDYTNVGSGGELGNPTFSANNYGTWVHYSIPLVGASQQNLRALTFSLYENGPGGSFPNIINGVLNIDVDNIVITTPGSTPEPASLGLALLAAPRLLKRRR